MKPLDFESWNREFRSLARRAEWAYFADGLYHVFHEQAPRMRRLRLGIPGWIASNVAGMFAPGERRAAVEAEAPFLLLPQATEAHELSLLPFARQLEPGQAVILRGNPERWKELGHPLVDLPEPATAPHPADLWTAWSCARAAFRAARKAWGGASDPARSWWLMASLADRALAVPLWERSGSIPVPKQALVLTYELAPLAKAACRQARKENKRVIHIMHGQRLPTYQVTMATDLVLFSKVDEAWFRARVAPETRIWTIGHPRLESVRQEVGTPGPWQEGRRPRITFFSQPSEGDYTRELRRRDWALLAPLKGRAELRIRLHPRESRQQAEEDLAAIGLDFVELSGAGLVEDLRWCDAVASSWSTVSMEAAACGRGVFWTCTTPEAYEPSAELRDHGIGTLIQRAEDWGTHLDAWSAKAWGEPVIVPENRLRELGMIGDMTRSWAERLELGRDSV